MTLPKKTRGRPRSEKSKQAILNATYNLLVNYDLKDITMEAIVKESGVSKATLYKWWPNRAAVIMSSFLHLSVDRIPYPPNLISKQTIIERLQHMGREFCGPVGRMMAALIAECQSDPKFSKNFRENYIKKRRLEIIGLIEDAMDLGVLRRTDANVLLDTIYGPLYYRLLIKHEELSEEFVNNYLNLIFDGIFVSK